MSGAVGVKLFTQALKNNSTLKYLGLTDTQLGVEGIKILKDVVISNKTFFTSLIFSISHRYSDHRSVQYAISVQQTITLVFSLEWCIPCAQIQTRRNARQVWNKNKNYGDSKEEAKDIIMYMLTTYSVAAGDELHKIWSNFFGY